MGIVSVRIRKQVFRKCDGKCAYCGNTIAFKGPLCFQVDHLHPGYWNWSDERCAAEGVVRGTDEVSNLMPSCRGCNRNKSSKSLELFRENTKLKTPEWDGLFYFEKMRGFIEQPLRVTATIR